MAELPLIVDVASLMPTRTKTKLSAGGVEVGTFTTDTRPSLDDATRAVERAGRAVYSKLGAYANLPASVQDAATDLVALRAAIDLERSFFADQLDAANSPYKALLAQWQEDLPSTIQAVQEAEDDGGVVEPGAGAMPHYGFPMSERVTDPYDLDRQSW